MKHSRYKQFGLKPLAYSQGMALLAMFVICILMIFALMLSMHLKGSHSRQKYRDAAGNAMSTIVNLALTKASQDQFTGTDNNLQDYVNDVITISQPYLINTAQQAGYLLKNAVIHVNNSMYSPYNYTCPNVQDLVLSDQCTNTTPGSNYCYFQGVVNNAADGHTWVGVKYVNKNNKNYTVIKTTDGAAMIPGTANLLKYQPPGVTALTNVTFLSCHATVQDNSGNKGYVIMWPQDQSQAPDTSYQCQFAGQSAITPNSQNAPITCDSDSTGTCRLVCKPIQVQQNLHELTFDFPLAAYSDQRNVLNTVMSQLDISKVANVNIDTSKGHVQVQVWIYGGGSPI